MEHIPSRRSGAHNVPNNRVNKVERAVPRALDHEEVVPVEVEGVGRAGGAAGDGELNDAIGREREHRAGGQQVRCSLRAAQDL